MTVSTDNRRVQYATNGTTGPFNVPFQFLDPSHLAVTYADSAGVELLLVMNVGYTVAGNAVTTTLAYAAGGTITIERDVPITQELDLRDGDDFPPDSVERALDKLTMIDQQTAGRLRGVLRVPEVATELPPLPVAAARANKQLLFDVAGDPYVAAPASGSAADVVLALADATDPAKGDALVAVKQPFSGAGARTQHDKNADTLHVRDAAGFVGDGIADDTAAILAVHTAANLIGASVDYSGVRQFAIQADAQVPLKTSTDFSNSEIIILGGVNTPPGFSSFNNLFIVSDDACPLVTVTGPVAAADLAQNSFFPTRGLFAGHGFALVTCGLQVPNRATTGTENYKQAFKVNHGSRVSHPLSVDLSAFAAAITVSYRKTSVRRLTINGLSVRSGAWNNQCLLSVQRCNVRIQNTTLIYDGANYDDVSRLISVDNASDIEISRFVTVGRPVTLSNGSYCLRLEGVADIYLDGLNAITGWGATGCNNVNGWYVTNSVLNRVDVHGSGHNIFVDKCDLHEVGVVYGWGGGVIKVTNNRCYSAASIISNRVDWGGSFFGELIATDNEFIHTGTSTLYGIDLETNPLGASTPVTAPRQIIFHGNKRVGRASSASNNEFIAVRLRIRDAASFVYAPLAISVIGVEAQPGWRFGLRIDWNNLEANPVTTACKIEVANVIASTQASSSVGIVDYPNVRTVVTRIRPILVISDSQNINILCRATNSPEIYISDSTVNGIATDPANPVQPLVNCVGCKFLTPAFGYASPSPLAPVGGHRTGPNNYTSLADCEFATPEVWDLSKVSSAIGINFRIGGAPVLPPGVTAAMFFAGWQEAGAFQ